MNYQDSQAPNYPTGTVCINQVSIALYLTASVEGDVHWLRCQDRSGYRID